MVEKLVATTEQESLKLLGTPGQRSFELIYNTLLESLGLEYALLFTEPVPSQHGDHVSWYAEMDQVHNIRPLSAMGEQKEAAKEVLGKYIAAILEYVEKLENSPKKNNLRLAEALRNAVEIPDEKSIYIAERGDPSHLQPLLVNWASHIDVSTPKTGVLSVYVPKIIPTPEPNVAEEADSSSKTTATTIPPVTNTMQIGNAIIVQDDRSNVLYRAIWMFLWLLLITLIVGLSIILVPLCGVYFGVKFDYCPQRSSVVYELDSQNNQLSNQIALLERQLAEMRADCPPNARAHGAAQNIDEVKRRLENEQAQDAPLAFSLIWDNISDLDLYLICPNGKKIFFREKRKCGGALNIDMNNVSSSDVPVEHVVFPNPENTQKGRYTIGVFLYTNRVSPSTVHKFSLLIKDGDHQEFLHGKVSNQSKEWVYVYNHQ